MVTFILLLVLAIVIITVTIAIIAILLGSVIGYILIAADIILGFYLFSLIFKLFRKKPKKE